MKKIVKKVLTSLQALRMEVLDEESPTRPPEERALPVSFTAPKLPSLL